MGGFKDKLKVIPADMGKVTQAAAITSLLISGTMFCTGNKQLQQYSKIAWQVTSLCGFAWLCFGQSSVTNRSDEIIYCLDEVSGQIKKCLPGETLHNIDGIRVGDKVYKVSDGVSVQVSGNNKVEFTSFFSSVYQKMVSVNFLLTTPDEYFKPLFEV